ncbi:sigma-70 family RNA polymerase sigma factor [Planococcus halocryophilus]|uniref:sigma-70 family RNA polymerase sigma factor n=1 Tax=Planococcus halocryophilus TaxID=1215089 RepID=UPI001F0D8326|nr:sigma-70 family RNA polymerase sigma factor [Planococcus halocryophilus]MCH4825182.1 sigma-70 family RNA polymerase sigma factor [Planococcus halocryophilus]
MYTKKLSFSDGTSREMSFEDVLFQFKPLLKSVLRKTNNKFIFNKVEEEDFFQELSVELWKAYEKYDSSYETFFSTYLYYRLQKGVRDATYSKFSKKNQGIEISMDTPLGNEDIKFEDIFSTPDVSIDNLLGNDLIKIIQSNIEPHEEEMLRTLINRKHFSIKQYAEKYGITRQAANQRIVKLRNKLKKLVKEQYFEQN